MAPMCRDVGDGDATGAYRVPSIQRDTGCAVRGRQPAQRVPQSDERWWREIEGSRRPRDKHEKRARDVRRRDAAALQPEQVLQQNCDLLHALTLGRFWSCLAERDSPAVIQQHVVEWREPGIRRTPHERLQQTQHDGCSLVKGEPLSARGDVRKAQMHRPTGSTGGRPGFQADAAGA
jgi:hypothetical protein